MARKHVDYASLFVLRKDGRYQGYWYERDSDGRPIGRRHSISDKDPKKLYDAIKEKEKPIKGITFRAIANAWKEREWDGIRRGTRVCYSPAYKRAIEKFGQRDASSITPHEIWQHLEQLKYQGYSAKTIDTQRIVYRAIFRYAIVDEKYGRYVKTNPVSDVKLPRNLPPPKKREAPPDEIVEAVRKNAETAFFGLFPLFLMSTGFRRGEALSIRWKDIDFDNLTIYLTEQVNFSGGVEERTTPKTSAGVRDVPLLPDLYSLLLKAKPKEAAPEDYVFHSTDPKKWIPQKTYQRYWKRYCTEMGFVTIEKETYTDKNGKTKTKERVKNNLTAHVFRHGYATMLYEAGVDAYQARVFLGHSDIATTMEVYTHLRERKKNEGVEKLQSYVQSLVKGSPQNADSGAGR